MAIQEPDDKPSSTKRGPYFGTLLLSIVNWFKNFACSSIQCTVNCSLSRIRTLKVFVICPLIFLISWANSFGQPDTSVAAVKMKQARALYTQNLFDSAEFKFGEAADIYKHANDWSRFIEAAVQLNQTYFRNLKFELAKSHVSELLTLAETKVPAKSLSIAHILDCLGNLHIWEGKFELSISQLKRSLQIKQDQGASIHDLARTFDYLGDAYRNLDQMDLAVYHYEEMLSLYESSNADKNHINIAKGLSDLAILSRQRGEFELALSQYKRAIAIVEKQEMEDPHALSAILNGMGVIYATTGRYPEALEYFNRLLKNDIKALPADHPDLAKVYTNLGILHELMGDFKQSVTLHEKALHIKSKSLGPNNPSLIYDYKGLAQVHINIGDVEQTLLYAHKTEQLELEHLGPQSRNLAMSYLILGSANNLKGDYHAALNYLQRSESIIAAKNPTDPQIGPIYHNISAVHTAQMKYDSAILFANKALKINEMNFGKVHPHVAGNRRTLGQNYQLLGNLSEAEKYYRQALNITLEVDGKNHQNAVTDYIKLGENMRLAKRYQQGLTYFQSALLAACVDFGDTSIFSNPTAEQSRLPKDAAIALAGKGKTLRDLYFATDDLTFLKSAADAFSRSSEMISEAQFSYKAKGSVALLKQDLASVYESAIEVCHLLYQATQKKEHINRALQYAEQGKATLLLAALNESRARKFAGIPADLLEKENILRRDLTYYEQQAVMPAITAEASSQIATKIFSLKSEYDSLVSILENRYPKYHSLKFNSSVISMYDLQENLLQENETLIEYYVGEDFIYTILITKQQCDFIRMPLSDSPLRLITELFEMLRDQTVTSQDFSALSHQLFNILVKPIKPEFLKPSLVLVPDGILNYLPFEVLTKHHHEDAEFFSLPYLFVDHSISYAYSATFLRDIKNDNSKNVQDNFLAFAPTFENRASSGQIVDINIETTQSSFRGQLSELKGAATEVQALASHFKGNFYEAKDATESAFKENAEKFGMLHLATHAIIDDVNPMNSKLLFTAGEDSLEDADLHAWELYNMDLNANLAVLSACNTGFGKIQKGEGVLSLGRAFAYAGCPSIVMSLWPAQDLSTTKIMSTFYKFIAEGSKKDDALREAKLAYIRTAEEYNAHPFYWAGFILQGSHDSVMQPSYWASSWIFWCALSGIVLLGFLFLQRALGKETG